MKRTIIQRALLSAAFASSAVLASGAVSSIHAAPTAIFPPPLTACQATLQSYVNWAKAGRPVRFYLSSNQQYGNLVSYASGPLYLNYASDSLVGWGAQYFNDRTYSYGTGVAPFNPAATDKLYVSIDLRTDAVTLTLASWGYTRKYVPYPACANGVLCGFINSAPTGLITMSFAQLPGTAGNTGVQPSINPQPLPPEQGTSPATL